MKKLWDEFKSDWNNADQAFRLMIKFLLSLAAVIAVLGVVMESTPGPWKG